MNDISTEIDQLGRQVARNIDNKTMLLPDVQRFSKASFLDAEKRRFS
jgi:hypothetical protein